MRRDGLLRFHWRCHVPVRLGQRPILVRETVHLVKTTPRQAMVSMKECEISCISTRVGDVVEYRLKCSEHGFITDEPVRLPIPYEPHHEIAVSRLLRSIRDKHLTTITLNEAFAAGPLSQQLPVHLL